ncbi:MAG: hypothetical protein ACK5HL_04800 [Bacilli bacterium]
MQKFRDYIYVDDDRIKSYINQIPEFHKIEISNSYERDTKVDGGVDLKLVKTGTELSEKNTTNYTTSMNDLERMVTWSLNDKNAIYFDNCIKLENSDKDKMIILEGTMKMPKMVENIETIQALRSNTALFSMIPNFENEDDMKTLSLMKDSDNIPILLEVDSDYIVSCSVKRTLTSGTNDFLDSLDETITIIGKIDRVYNIEDKVEIYDMGKEVLKLNRTIRRSLNDEDLKNMIVTEDAPLIKVIPIIIYK